MPKAPKSLVPPLTAKHTKLVKAKSTPAANPDAKPKVYTLRCGTTHQLGPQREFTSDAACKKAAGEFFKEAIPWANRFEKAAVERIQNAVEAIAALPEMHEIGRVHTVECMVDSYTELVRVVEMRKIKAPPKPKQLTIIK